MEGMKEDMSPRFSVLSFSTTDCSGTVADRIAEKYARLQVLLKEEAELRGSIDEMFAEEAAQASEDLKQAQAQWEVIEKKQAEMRALMDRAPNVNKAIYDHT